MDSSTCTLYMALCVATRERVLCAWTGPRVLAHGVVHGLAHAYSRMRCVATRDHNAHLAHVYSVYGPRDLDFLQARINISLITVVTVDV